MLWYRCPGAKAASPASAAAAAAAAAGGSGGTGAAPAASACCCSSDMVIWPLTTPHSWSSACEAARRRGRAQRAVLGLGASRGSVWGGPLMIFLPEDGVARRRTAGLTWQVALVPSAERMKSVVRPASALAVTNSPGKGSWLGSSFCSTAAWGTRRIPCHASVRRPGCAPWPAERARQRRSPAPCPARHLGHVHPPPAGPNSLTSVMSTGEKRSTSALSSHTLRASGSIDSPCLYSHICAGKEATGRRAVRQRTWCGSPRVSLHLSLPLPAVLTLPPFGPPCLPAAHRATGWPQASSNRQPALARVRPHGRPPHEGGRARTCSRVLGPLTTAYPGSGRAKSVQLKATSRNTRHSCRSPSDLATCGPERHTRSATHPSIAAVHLC